MSIQLQLAALWLPKFLLIRQLRHLAEQSTAALDALLEEHAPEALSTLRRGGKSATDSLEAQQSALAAALTDRITALVAAIGEDETQRLGHKALFTMGVRVGEELRKLLEVSELPADLTAAAQIFYKTLGVHFNVEEADDEHTTWRIERCALAPKCSGVTCRVLSGVEEGIIQGLNPWVSMTFDAYIPDGAPACIAHLNFLPRRSVVSSSNIPTPPPSPPGR